MATFRIHQDTENDVPKIRTTKETQKRPVLGTRSNNTTQFHDPPTNKISEELTTCHDRIRDEIKSAVHVEEKCALQPKPKASVATVEAEPVAAVTTKDANDSPMSIDGSTPVKPSLPPPEPLPGSILVPYQEDIYDYLRTLETQYQPKAYYMKRQPDISYHMRTTLIDWLVEVGEEYKLHDETLYMTVSFIDRFLSCMAVVRAKLQLLGTSAMFIASKFEEVYPPEVGEFTYITDDTYTKKQVLRMEHLILKVLSFKLSAPTAYTFMTHILATVRLTGLEVSLAKYICELTLLEADPYIEFSPSLIASASIALARHCLGIVDVWPQELIKTTKYTLKNLAPVIGHLNETHSKSFILAQVAIKDKYKSVKNHQASTIPHRKLIIRDTNSS